MGYFFTEFLFLEIPNLIQLISAIFIFSFIIYSNDYILPLCLFSLSVFLYLTSKSYVFLKSEIVDVYSNNKDKYKIPSVKSMIIWVVMIFILVLILAIFFYKLIIEIKKDQIIRDCKIDIILNKDMTVEKCIDNYLNFH